MGGSFDPSAPPGSGREGELVVVRSGSGETPTLVQLTRAARDAGGRITVVTGTATSSQAALARVLVDLPECSRDGVRGESARFVGTLFEQDALFSLDTIVLTLEAPHEADRARMLDRHTDMEWQGPVMSSTSIDRPTHDVVTCAKHPGPMGPASRAMPYQSGTGSRRSRRRSRRGGPASRHRSACGVPRHAATSTSPGALTHVES